MGNDIENKKGLVSSPTGTINGHGYVDLGLSVKWATCNVGASTPSDYGDHFAWGETSPKASYNEGNCSTYEMNLLDIAGDPRYDAARANWGGSWRLPTASEIDELIEKCKWKKAVIDDHCGYKVTGSNGNSLFFPVAGYRYGTSLYDADDFGCYWSAASYESNTYDAFYLLFHSYDIYKNWFGRYYGYSVRPVSD